MGVVLPRKVPARVVSATGGGPAPASGARWGRDGAHPTAVRFLRGPQPRGSELLHALRIFREFVTGFRALHFVGPCVTVFGSARFGEQSPYYALGRAVGAELARAGFTVMTGGGPGLMAAANRGAWEAGGQSIGGNIEMTKAQNPTPLLAFLRERLLGEGTIDPGDLGLLTLTDSPAAAIERIRDVALEAFARSYGPRARRRWFLGERG